MRVAGTDSVFFPSLQSILHIGRRALETLPWTVFSHIPSLREPLVDNTGVLCSLGLFTCVAAILLAMAQFWLRTPLLRTLEQLASLAFVSVPLSVAALRAQAAAETKAQKAD